VGILLLFIDLNIDQLYVQVLINSKEPSADHNIVFKFHGDGVTNQGLEK
jgi:hypothetical protein